MKGTFFILPLAVALAAGCNRQDGIYNVLDFGARGNGKKINTEALNKAIRKCHEKGGGTVLVPPGTYITGTVVLLSGVNLHLEPGAMLLGSKDTADYLLMKNIQFNEGYNRYGVIMASSAVNISITGSGEINGQGTSFMNGLDKPHLGGNDFDRKYIRQGDEFMKAGTVFEDGPVSYDFRPAMLITLEGCEGVHIRDVTMKDSPEWTMRIVDCDDVLVSGITIVNNQLIPNSDGIHVTTSRNVRISDCYIFAGDDAIIVTGFGNSPVPPDTAKDFSNGYTVGNKTGIAENVTVTNCVLSSRSACIRVGYGNHPIRNLTFSNIVMYNSNRGIGVFARDNSRIENVIFSGIIINNRLHSGHWWGKGEPIHVSALRDTENGVPGTISNIRFSNITAASETGILVYGIPESIIRDLYFDNIRLTVNSGRYTDSYGGNFDLRPAYPRSLAIFSHDIPGIYAQYVRNIKIQDFELTWGDNLPTFFTCAAEISHYEDLTIERFSGDNALGKAGEPSIRLSQGKNAMLRDCRTSTGAAVISHEYIR